MNQNFSQWSRSSAFNLSLSEPAIHELIFMYNEETAIRAAGHDVETYGNYMYDKMRVSYLVRRGLIRRVDRDGFHGNFCLTTEGSLVAQLLLAAGFKTEHLPVYADCVRPKEVTA